jgi:hypothetical protein
MEQNHVDQVIAEATIAPGTVEDTPQTVENEPSEGEQVSAEKKEIPEFDKKFENMKARLKNEKRAAQYEAQKLRAELDQLRAQQQPKNQPQNDGAPDENDPKYQNYGDYLKDVVRWEAKQALQEGQKAQQEQQVSERVQAYKAEREQVVSEMADKAIESIPDFKNILTEHVDILDHFPPHIEMAFLEADNAPLAFYALAKEGKLESLLTMSPNQAAMAIGRAQDRGEAMTKKPTTNAPAPLSANKGTGTGSKSPDSMSYAELKAAGFTGR